MPQFRQPLAIRSDPIARPDQARHCRIALLPPPHPTAGSAEAYLSDVDSDSTMSDDQISLPYFLVILVILGLIIRYLFGGNAAAQPTRSPEALLRTRELAVERIQQMFPQAERRSILWDLQRNGMNIQNTTERILAGRLETVRTDHPPPGLHLSHREHYR